MQNQNLSEILDYEQGLQIGDKAYVFEAVELSGEKVSIEAKSALLIFFNSTCEACEITAPRWQELYEEYSSAEIKIIGISKEPEETIREFILRHDLSFPIILDTEKKIIKKYRVKSSPQVVMVSREGKIIYYSRYGTGAKKALNQAEEIIQKTIATKS